MDYAKEATWYALRVIHWAHTTADDRAPAFFFFTSFPSFYFTLFLSISFFPGRRFPYIAWDHLETFRIPSCAVMRSRRLTGSLAFIHFLGHCINKWMALSKLPPVASATTFQTTAELLAFLYICT